jgi:hypothetical protein
MTSWPHSRSCITASIRSGRAGGLPGELALACQNAKEHLELGAVRNDPIVKSTAALNSAVAWFLPGEFVTAQAYAEQALELQDIGYSSLYAVICPQDPWIGALITLSRALVCLGHLDQARLRRDEALAKARQRAHAHTLALVLAAAWDRDAAVRSEPTRCWSAPRNCGCTVLNTASLISPLSQACIVGRPCRC